MTLHHYILIGKKIKTVPLLEWAEWFQTANRWVGDTIVGDLRVSTIFLGLDHNFTSKGKPILFETMVFETKITKSKLPNTDREISYHKDVGIIDRYCTWAQAERGHKLIVQSLRRTQRSKQASKSRRTQRHASTKV